ncbi:MAG: hypothetical protein ACREQR_07250 [Candidatus Binataceae bacterium]
MRWWVVSVRSFPTCASCSATQSNRNTSNRSRPWRRELAARGIDARVSVASAGIAPYARDGALVSLDTRLALREVGIDIGEEATSTDLKRHPEILDGADLIIAMTEQQARELIEKFPGANGRIVHTLRSFTGTSGDINDPYEQGDVVFAQCREEINRLIPPLIDRLYDE